MEGAIYKKSNHGGKTYLMKRYIAFVKNINKYYVYMYMQIK